MFGRTMAIAATIVLAATTAVSHAQTVAAPLTNADVIRMTSARLGDAVIIGAIEKAPRRAFDLSVDGLIALKQGGVSDGVIVAMQKAAIDKPAAAPPAPATPPATATPLAPPRPVPAPPPSAVPHEPPNTVFDVFRVNPATGELIPLETPKPKEPRFSAIKTVHFEGAESPIVFKYGEPIVFATRTFFSLEQLRKEKAETRTYRLERLAVKDGRRYASRVYVLLDIEEYGKPVYGLSGGKGKNDLPAYAYLMKPQTTLVPGQYAFTYGGMLEGFAQAAFAIAER
jgi:hypothetical protein